MREGAVSGWHQGQVTWLIVKLFEHVRGRGLGEMRPAPCDVVLDEEKALVLQPDVLVLLGDRVELLGDKIYGAPDLVVEVASPSTRRRDRTRKVVWYRSYGVRECWLVDDDPESITVHYFASNPEPKPRTFRGSDRFESRVLPEFTPLASELFDPMSRGLGGLRSREAARAHWQARARANFTSSISKTHRHQKVCCSSETPSSIPACFRISDTRRSFSSTRTSNNLRRARL